MKDFRCLALAMPKLDISTTKTDVSITTIVDRENAIMEFVDAMDIQECILMGHSMGGPMVLSATCNHPERIKGLIIISSVGAQEYRVFKMSKPRWGYKLMTAPLIGWMFKPFMMWVFKNWGSQKVSVRMRCSMSYIALRISLFKRTNEPLERCQTPVLNISSQDDPYVEPELFEEIEDLVPNCERLSFEKGCTTPNELMLKP